MVPALQAVTPVHIALLAPAAPPLLLEDPAAPVAPPALAPAVFVKLPAAPSGAPAAPGAPLRFETFPAPPEPTPGVPPAPSEVSDAGAPHAATASESTVPVKTSAKDEPRNRGETMPQCSFSHESSVFISARDCGAFPGKANANSAGVRSFR
jgi:hypothetical protein